MRVVDVGDDVPGVDGVDGVVLGSGRREGGSS